MARYQNNKSRGLSESLFRSCFGDLPEEEQINVAKKLGKIQEVCKL